MPSKNLSIAVDGVASGGRAIVPGTPVLNGKGDVMGIHTAKIRLPSQTFVLADPAAGLSARIAEAVKQGVRIKVPIPIKDQPFDPVDDNKHSIGATYAELKNDYVQMRNPPRPRSRNFPTAATRSSGNT